MLNKEWRGEYLVDSNEGTFVDAEDVVDLDDVLHALSRMEEMLESILANSRQEQPVLEAVPLVPMSLELELPKEPTGETE